MSYVTDDIFADEYGPIKLSQMEATLVASAAMPPEERFHFNFSGGPGIGKTAVTNSFKQKGYNVVSINVATMIQAALGGIIDLGHKDAEGKVVEYIRVKLPQMIHQCTIAFEEEERARMMAASVPGSAEYEAAKTWKAPPYLIVLDDWQAATKLVQSVIMPMLDGRKSAGMFNDHPLRPDGLICMCSNDESHGVRTRSQADAAVNRRIQKVPVVTDPVETLAHFSEIEHEINGQKLPFHQETYKHLMKNPGHMNPMEGPPAQQKRLQAQKAFPSSRVWKAVSALSHVHENIENPDAHVYAITVANMLGAEHALPYLKAVLKDPNYEIPENISLEQVETVVRYAEMMPHEERINPRIAGAPGTGKTAKLKNFQKKGYKFVSFNVATMIQAALGGVIDLGSKDAEGKIVEYVRVKLPQLLYECTDEFEEEERQRLMSVHREGTPEWLEAKEHKEPPYIILLDDWQAATPNIQSAVMPMLDGRRAAGMFNDFHMRSNGVVMFASNDERHNVSTASPQDAAVNNRMVTIDMVTNPKETLDYFAKETHVIKDIKQDREVELPFDSLTLEYLSKFPDHINPGETSDREKALEIFRSPAYPNSAKWSSISAWNQACRINETPEQLHKRVVVSALGKKFAPHYLEYLDNAAAQEIPAVADVLTNPASIAKFKDRRDLLPNIVDQLIKVAGRDQATYDQVVDVALQLDEIEKAHILHSLTSRNGGETTNLAPFMRASRHAEFLRQFFIERTLRQKNTQGQTKVEQINHGRTTL